MEDFFVLINIDKEHYMAQSVRCLHDILETMSILRVEILAGKI